jgi:hypothetical protein
VQTRALKKLKDVSPGEIQRITAKVEASSETAIKSDSKKSAQIKLKDLSGREIEGLSEKAARSVFNLWVGRDIPDPEQHHA